LPAALFHEHQGTAVIIAPPSANHAYHRDTVIPTRDGGNDDDENAIASNGSGFRARASRRGDVPQMMRRMKQGGEKSRLPLEIAHVVRSDSIRRRNYWLNAREAFAIRSVPESRSALVKEQLHFIIAPSHAKCQGLTIVRRFRCTGHAHTYTRAPRVPTGISRIEIPIPALGSFPLSTAMDFYREPLIQDGEIVRRVATANARNVTYLSVISTECGRPAFDFTRSSAAEHCYSNVLALYGRPFIIAPLEK